MDLRWLTPEFIEEGIDDFMGATGLTNTQFVFLEHLNRLFSIHEFNRRDTVSRCFSACLCGESPRHDYDSLVGTTRHCSPKVAHLRRGNRTRVAFALPLRQEVQAVLRRVTVN
jgi:hypothetical protein